MLASPRLRALAAPLVVVATLAALAACGSGSARPAPSPEPSTGASNVVASDVSPAEIQQVNVQRVEELLTGRVAGLRVVRLPTGDLSLRIRNSTSLGSEEEPLLVIDGMPIAQGNIGGALSALTPRDIQRVRVLKDPAETAFYGSRGANGVVIITTRKGKN